MPIKKVDGLSPLRSFITITAMWPVAKKLGRLNAKWMAQRHISYPDAATAGNLARLPQGGQKR